MEVDITRIVEASPALALAGFSIYVAYKVSMRALDVLQQNTKALAALEESIKEDRRA